MDTHLLPLDIEVSRIDGTECQQSQSNSMPPHSQSNSMPPPSQSKLMPPPTQTSTNQIDIDVSQGPFICECGKICQRKESLTQHKKVCKTVESVANHTKSVMTFECTLCSTHCATNRSLKQHTGSGTCIKRQQRSKSATLTLALSNSTSSGINEEGHNETNEAHANPENNVINEANPEDNETIESNGEPQSIPTSSSAAKKTLQCEICNKDHFKTATGLANHKRIVHKAKPGDKNLRKVQQKTIEKSKRLSTTLPIELELSCEICGLKCTTKVGMKLHMVKCRKTAREL